MQGLIINIANTWLSRTSYNAHDTSPVFTCLIVSGFVLFSNDLIKLDPILALRLSFSLTIYDSSPPTSNDTSNFIKLPPSNFSKPTIIFVDQKYDV